MTSPGEGSSSQHTSAAEPDTGAANRPAPNQTAIEVDDEATNPSLNSDDDEGYTESIAGSNATTSLSSSVRDYTFENNRRYHKFHEGKYHFPNDEPEQAREDMRHCMMVHVGGGALHYAPLKNPQKVLDVGTGTGIWAIDSESPFSPCTLRSIFDFEESADPASGRRVPRGRGGGH